MKKGVFFSLDAFFAVILIGAALVLTSQYYISEVKIPQAGYYAKDILRSFSNIRVSEIDDPFVAQLIADGVIIYPNNTVMEQIGEFYVLNRTDLARNLSMSVSQFLVPDKFGFEILVNDESVYLRSSAGESTELISSRRLISGIEKFKPVRGATSKVFLESIKSKRFSSYLYFGGYVGQGNITGFIDDIPKNISVSSIYLELDAGAGFGVLINGNLCRSSLAAGYGAMTADGFDLSSCNSSIAAGARNNFTLLFNSTLGSSYIGGGFVRVDYYTDELQGQQKNHTVTEYLPDITGIINLYSSFYVPGTLDNITVYLHYYIINNETNNTMYFTIGNATVFRDNNFSGEKSRFITAGNITDFISLSLMNSRTVPIRAGFENVTFGYIYEGNADVAIITDISGSMDSKMDSGYTGIKRNCNDTNFNLTTTSRLSVAKCLDKQFARHIINITGNTIGLVSYSTSTSGTLYPTTDLAVIDTAIGTSVPETGYNGNGYTCICCGINSAVSMLMANVSITTFIANKSSWLYNNFSLKSLPQQDYSGNNWYDLSYGDESGWFTGNAVIGATNSYPYSPAINKETGSNLTGEIVYANLWENTGDTAGPPNDFTSNILNSSANTFGISGNNDGWDWSGGAYDYSGSMSFDNVVGGRLQIFSLDNNKPVSGAYGITVNISDELYGIISSPNGKATLSFNYYWAETGNFESSDHVWVKGRWTSPSSGIHWLGSDMDSAMSNYDSTSDIASVEDPDDDITNGFFSQDLQAWIESSGNYYLDLGGKLLRNSNNEDGYFKFDNIEIQISNGSNHYYFRKHFTITNISQAQRGILNVLSDDMATVYINGQKVNEDNEDHLGEYWNQRGKFILGSMFRAGDNVVAVEVTNAKNAAKFDLELLGSSDSRSKAMMVMTDGQANYECTPHQYSTANAPQDAVGAACEARQRYGITVYSVGYSADAEENTLQNIADCGDGIFVKSDNTTVLEEFYQDVASTIVSASRHSQSIQVEGDISASRLYGDSYIKIDYTPLSPDANFGQISLIREEKNFDNCTFSVNIPSDIAVSDAKLTSYSSEHWTDILIANSNDVYNLSRFSSDYSSLGDPFIINIPETILVPGINTFTVRTGDNPQNSTSCSANNTLIYTAHVAASVSYSEILEKAEGCIWTIEFDDGGSTVVKVPPAYAGIKSCYYTGSLISYDGNDTYDDAMFSLLDNLDFDNDGRIYVNIEEHNFVVGAISVGRIPYPWGPAIAEVRVWK